jgi:hypothetical protein
MKEEDNVEGKEKDEAENRKKMEERKKRMQKNVRNTVFASSRYLY